MLETLLEQAYATGRIDSLPKGMPTPPPWAISAIKLANERFLKPIKKLTPEVIGRDPMGALQEAIGLFVALRSHLHRDTTELIKDEPRTAEFRALEAASATIAPVEFLTYLRKLERVLEAKLPMPTPAELDIQSDRYRKGLREFVNTKDGLVALKTFKTQILFVVFFFWPRLDKLPKIRAEDLQKFLADEIGIFASIKTVEAIYTVVRLAERDKRRE